MDTAQGLLVPNIKGVQNLTVFEVTNCGIQNNLAEFLNFKSNDIYYEVL